MGNLILCQAKPAERPYYVAELGIHLYSAEELCYFIYHNVLMIDASFPDDRLLDFLHQLEQFKLEDRVRRMREQSGLYEILYVILQDLRYFNGAELFAFRKQLEQLSQTSTAGRLKQKGDALFERGQYYNAVRIYNQLLSSDCRELADSDYVGRIWTCKAACLARMENYGEAMECLQKAYALTREVSLLEKMYVLERLKGRDAMPIGLEKLVSPPILEQFRSNFENRMNLAQYQGKALEAAALKDKPEPERSEAYLELLFRWKEEYRKNQIS